MTYEEELAVLPAEIDFCSSINNCSTCDNEYCPKFPDFKTDDLDLIFPVD